MAPSSEASRTATEPMPRRDTSRHAQTSRVRPGRAAAKPKLCSSRSETMAPSGPTRLWVARDDAVFSEGSCGSYDRQRDQQREAGAGQHQADQLGGVTAERGSTGALMRLPAPGRDRLVVARLVMAMGRVTWWSGGLRRYTGCARIPNGMSRARNGAIDDARGADEAEADDGARRIGWSWLIVCYAFLYLPIAFLIGFSFNASRSVTAWSGFSLALVLGAAARRGDDRRGAAVAADRGGLGVDRAGGGHGGGAGAGAVRPVPRAGGVRGGVVRAADPAGGDHRPVAAAAVRAAGTR